MHLRWCEKRKIKEESGVVDYKKKKERDTSFETTESEDDVEGDEMLIDAEDNDGEYENENDESVEEEEEEDEEEGDADNQNENEEEDDESEDEDDDDDLDKWALDDPTAVSSSSSSSSPSSSKAAPTPHHVLLPSVVFPDKTDESKGTYSSVSTV